MKFTAKIVSTLVLAAVLLTTEASAGGVRGTAKNQERDLGVTCITSTGADGVPRTLKPCSTSPPAATTAGDEESEDSKEESVDDPLILNALENDEDDLTVPATPSQPGNGNPLVVAPNPSQPSGNAAELVGNQQAAVPVKPDIVGAALGTPSLRSLVQLVAYAGLIPTLRGPGPFTVFAPINSALPTGAAFNRLQVDPSLKSILTYHVVPGTIRSTDLFNGMIATTVQGGNATVSVNGTSVKINDANVILADVETSNGIVHLIDAVLMPPGVMLAPVTTPTGPGTPGTGGTSTTPMTPSTPGTPTTPQTPSTPGTSTTPMTPQTPATPVGEGCPAEFGCEFVNGVAGVRVCRGMSTRCVLPTMTQMGDTCGCCPGNSMPECSGIAANSGQMAQQAQDLEIERAGGF